MLVSWFISMWLTPLKSDVPFQALARLTLFGGFNFDLFFKLGMLHFDMLILSSSESTEQEKFVDLTTQLSNQIVEMCLNIE